MRWHRLLGLLALAPVAAVAGLDVDPGAYRRAAGGGHGAVAGRAYETGAKSSAADAALAGTSVTLLPHSEAFLVRLEAIKREARDSLAAYRDAAVAVRRAREAYERALWAGDALDLVRSTDVAADGTFTIGDLPPGRWVLLAVRSVFVSKPSRRATKREAQSFALPPRVLGHATVQVWLMDLRIAGGRAERVELTERNTWLTGIVEEREPDAGR
jgi:hypothetical protein